MSEHAHQAALFEWAARVARSHPELELMYAIPNGGQRSKATAGKLRAEGVKAGVPDIHLPVARGRHHSLYIEMKYGKNKLTKEQAAWAARLVDAGHCVVTCYDWEEAAVTIANYLNAPCLHSI